MFCIEIDLSKKPCGYLLLNPEGQKVKAFFLENTAEVFQNLLYRLPEDDFLLRKTL
jgi:hypothetical protein